MKKIVLVRHAKAIEPFEEITDSERSLKIKGVKDAHKAAKKLFVFNIKPDLIISSPAFRALETALIFAEELDFPKKKIKLSESLYFDFTTGDFVEMIQKLDNKYETLFIFGHNPKISEMASQFTQDFHEELPTCGVTVIEFSEKKWKKINLREGKLSLYVFPDKEIIEPEKNLLSRLPIGRQGRQGKTEVKTKSKKDTAELVKKTISKQNNKRVNIKAKTNNKVSEKKTNKKQ